MPVVGEGVGMRNRQSIRSLVLQCDLSVPTLYTWRRLSAFAYSRWTVKGSLANVRGGPFLPLSMFALFYLSPHLSIASRTLGARNPAQDDPRAARGDPRVVRKGPWTH